MHMLPLTVTPRPFTASTRQHPRVPGPAHSSLVVHRQIVPNVLLRAQGIAYMDVAASESAAVMVRLRMLRLARE